VRLLLDTQVFLWMLSAPTRLSRRVQTMLRRPEEELLLSAASAWEISIKQGLGKLTLPEPAERYVPAMMAQFSVVPLAVVHRHALYVSALPPHHRDPFDRLLIAQAILEGVPIVSADAEMLRYDVEVLKA
jgi:PIN domain nuclease of toxin-antitoxin system